MVGFAPCSVCGGSFCEHQLPSHRSGDGALASVPPRGSGDAATEQRAVRLARLLGRAEAVYDEVDRLVAYYAGHSWNRDRNERVTRKDMRTRFAIKLIELLREVEEVRRGR